MPALFDIALKPHENHHLYTHIPAETDQNQHAYIYCEDCTEYVWDDFNFKDFMGLMYKRIWLARKIKLILFILIFVGIMIYKNYI